LLVYPISNPPLFSNLILFRLGNLPDGTELLAQIRESKLILKTNGTGDSIAEIGQIFAWLAGALRSSPFRDGVAICVPRIQATPCGDTASLPMTSKPKIPAEISCVVQFDIYQSSASEEGAPGQCWHKMFRNPVMVHGYPILSKQEHNLGLEMPLNMMARLAGSERANIFDGKIFIKGFSTMLVATKLIGDLLIWHYFYNSEGDRISYLDHKLQSMDNFSLQQLEATRHVVGCCLDCMYYAGK